MLGTAKWRLLTIVAGILLAHAIDSPGRSQKALPRKQRDTDLDIKIEKTDPWNVRVVRNLFQPEQTFSNIDNVRFIGRRQTDEGKVQNVIGAFRYPSTQQPSLTRRSDEFIQVIPIETLVNTSDYNVENFRVGRRSSNVHYIPLDQFTPHQQNYQNYQIHTVTKQPEIPQTTTTDVTYETTTTNSNVADVAMENMTARRSGLQFGVQLKQYQQTFIPQSYREDQLNFENIGVLQRPFNEEHLPDYDTRYSRAVAEGTPTNSEQFEPSRSPVQSPAQRPFIPDLDSFSSESNLRPTRVEFPGPSTGGTIVPSNPVPTRPIQSNAKQFRDDVTKFGDVNGPITAVQRQSSRPFDGNFYNEADFRTPRHYFPPKAYVEYSDYPGPPRQNPFYKTNRSPRVVFPPDSTTGFPSGPNSQYQIDNVVFR